jgi:hypothetical protein
MATLFSSSEPIAITGIAPMYSGATTAGHLAAASRSETQVADSSDDDWFDAAHYLGARKFKYLTKATRYALAAAGVALADAGITESTYSPEQCGAIVGTNFAVCGVHAEMDKVVLSEGAMSLSPMEAANFSVNLAASHISLRYGFRAFNACFTSSMVAGLEAVIFAAQSLRRGRCAVALAGATEAQPPASASGLTGRPSGGGAACLLVLESLQAARRRGAGTYAVVGQAGLRFASPSLLESISGQRQLECILREQLQRVIAAGQQRVTYCPLRLVSPLSQVVDEIITAELARRGVRVCRARYPGSDGALMSVSAVLQLAAAAMASPDCLVTATSPEGHIALLTLHAADTYGFEHNGGNGNK